MGEATYLGEAIPALQRAGTEEALADYEGFVGRYDVPEDDWEYLVEDRGYKAFEDFRCACTKDTDM